MAQKKYKSYASLRDKLKRASKLNPALNQYASMATFLLDLFIERNGYLRSETYYASKFVQPGKTYSQWVSSLKAADVLVQYKSEGNKGSDFIHYAPGPLIVEYINAEKGKTKSLVSIDEVPSKAEFEELKARMGKIEETVSELQAAMEPPDTEEKQYRRRSAADRLAQLSLVKSN